MLNSKDFPIVPLLVEMKAENFFPTFSSDVSSVVIKLSAQRHGRECAGSWVPFELSLWAVFSILWWPSPQADSRSSTAVSFSGCDLPAFGKASVPGLSFFQRPAYGVNSKLYPR